MDHNWEQIRNLFPVTKKYTYVNASEGSPVCPQAYTEAKRYYDETVAEGDLPWTAWLDRVEQVRGKVATCLNAQTKEVAFMLSASHGMNLIADMLEDKGDVITTADEFPTSTLPWLYRGFNVDFVQPDKNIYSMAKIEKAIKPNTKVVVMSYVEFCTGFRQDLVALGKLCKSKGLVFVVDATQGFGVMPIDVKAAQIDFLVFACLKWPLAGYGIAGFYMQEDWLSRVKLPVIGWRSVEDPDIFDNKNLRIRREASALEVGCAHFPNIFALGGGIDFLNQIGIKNVQERIFELNSYLEKKLQEKSFEILSPLERQHRSGITIVKVDNPREVTKEMIKRGVIISRRRDDGIRVSMHVYNNFEDIDRFVEELQNVTKQVPTS